MHGEQSERLLELRMACLEQRRKEASALGSTFGHANAAIVEKAVEAVAFLSKDATACSASALRNAKALPESPLARQKIEAAGEQLAAARVKFAMGDYDAARVHASPARVAASEASYAPVAAEAGLLIAETLRYSGQFANAEEAGLDATLLARRSGLPRVVAEGFERLNFIAGDSGDDARAGLYARLAEEAIAGLDDGRDELEANLRFRKAFRLLEQDKLPEADAEASRCIDLFERLGKARTKRLADALLIRSTVLCKRGHCDEAIATIQRSLGILAELYGEDSANALWALQSLAEASTSRARAARATSPESLPWKRRSLPAGAARSVAPG